VRGGHVEGVVAGEDGSAFPAHAASLAPAGFRMERTSAANARALAMAAGMLPTWPRSRSESEPPNEKMARKALRGGVKFRMARSRKLRDLRERPHPVTIRAAERQ
jgi:hypothetical protein